MKLKYVNGMNFRRGKQIITNFQTHKFFYISQYYGHSRNIYRSGCPVYRRLYTATAKSGVVSTAFSRRAVFNTLLFGGVVGSNSALLRPL